MKNKEKFEKEIMEVACSGDSIAVTKGSERIVKCGSIACSECLFAPPNCVKEIREWVEQEYIEKPVISKRDRAFWSISEKSVDTLQEIKMARCLYMKHSQEKGKSIGIGLVIVV